MTGPADEQEAWLGDVVASLDRRIASAGAQPDFLDVVARAHELDPEVTPAECLDEAAVLAPVLDIGVDHDSGSPEEEVVLDQWLGDVKAAVERQVDERAQGPRPELSATRDRRAVWWIGGAVLAAAIVVVLGIGMIVQVLSVGPVELPEQAQRVHERPGSTGSLEAPEPTPQVQPQPRTRVQPREVVEHEAVVLPKEPAEPKPAPAKRRSKPSKAERLKALAEQAQAHWRAGRRDEAQRLFEQIVSEGGRSRAAEMAYADLFTLASQAGDAGAKRMRWHAYLRRFPKGRFADDARAGLCRGTAEDQRTACWADYLADFPRGSFRAEARATQEK